MTRPGRDRWPRRGGRAFAPPVIVIIPPIDALFEDTAPVAADLACGPPRKIGRFEILGEIGAGGMGRVFAAHDPDLDRTVALKQIGSRGASGPSVARLQREAQAMARLSHPNVVQIHEVGVVDHVEHQVFIAMELVKGQTLRQWLDAGPRSWREILGAFVQAGRGLEAAHAAGIIHRDFKPQNVLVGADNRVRVADFGLAREGGAVGARSTGAQAPRRARRRLLATSLTVASAVMGTPAYMSPEQRRHQPVGPASDQFSFCVALFEALHGVRPQAGATVSELRLATRQGALQRHPGASRVPVWLHVAIARGLALDPAARWPSISALLDEVARDREAAGRRLRIMVLGLVATILGVTSGARLLQQNSRAIACQRAGDEIAGVWGPQRQARLARAFAGRATASARGTLERWRDEFDRQVARWREQRVQGCMNPSPEVAGWPYKQARVDRCFAEARDDLATVIDVVTRTAPLASESRGAWYWPDVDRCADDAASRAGTGYPQDPEGRRRWQQIRGRIIEGELAAGDGRHAEADGLLLAALAEARGLPGSTLALTATRILVRTRFEAGRRRQAWEALEGVSARPGGIPGDQLDLWKEDVVRHLLLGAASNKRGQPGLLIHSGGSSGYAIPISSNIGDAVRTTTLYVAGPDSVRFLQTYANVPSLIATTSEALVGLGDFEAAEALGRAGLSFIRANPAVLSDVYLALGRAHLGLGRLGTAWSALRSARAAAERSGAATAARRGWIMLAFAEFRLARGDLAGAAAEIAAAEQLAADIEGDDDRFVPALALVRAELHAWRGELDVAEGLLRTARHALIGSHGVARRLLLGTHFELGKLALARGNHAVADEGLSEALRLGEEIAGVNHVSLAPILIQIARLRRTQRDDARSLASLRRARDLIDGHAVSPGLREDIDGGLAGPQIDLARPDTVGRGRDGGDQAKGAPHIRHVRRGRGAVRSST